MRYEVRLLQTVTEGAFVEVEADNEEEAEALALEMADEAKWDFLEAGDARVAYVNEVEEGIEQ